MASQIRYFKTRYQQLRHLVERIKRDLAELKKYNHNNNGILKFHLWLHYPYFRTNGALQSENDQFRMLMDQRHNDQAPSNTFNSNGKRQMSALQ